GLNDNPPAPYLGVRYKNAVVASTQLPKIELETGNTFRRLLLRVDPDGKLYLAYGDRIFYNGLQLPNYSFTSAGKFGFYGRTGGENENQWIDNVQIQVTQSSGPLEIAAEPQDVLLLAGKPGTFTVVVSDPNGATYQWLKNGATIAGATASSYTTPATTVADHGSLFKVQATGPSGTATSREALLSVIAPITVINPQIIYDFNDGILPALPNQTILNTAAGGGYIDFFGGVTNSGVLKLTDAVEGQGGTFIIPDFNAGQPVKAFSAYWAMRLGGGTVPPADGVSFVWTEAADIPAGSVFGEAGAGDNLIVNFDLWNNEGEAPSFNIFYRNSLVAAKLVNVSELETGDNFADVFVRVNSDGTVDVQYNGNVIFHKVTLPGYTPVTGGVFAWGGRTGGSYENQWVDNIVLATTVGQIQVPIGFTRNGANLQMTWGAGFKLQSTPSLTTPNWQDVPNATSPHIVPMAGPAQFFRLINQP
ncbi:MAG TPA: hypothetical protein VN673_05130, partial [Clostridia bacterium]|nr:hypothetical protein [Clostridia bacterium]